MMQRIRAAKKGETTCSECTYGWKRGKYRSHWRCTLNKNVSGGKSYATGKDQTCDHAKAKESK